MSAIASLYTKLVGRAIDPLNEVLVTCGAYEALFCTILGNVNPGEGGIIMEPAFDCYEAMVKMAGATPVFIPLRCVSFTKYYTGQDPIHSLGFKSNKMNLKNLQ